MSAAVATEPRVGPFGIPVETRLIISVSPTEYRKTYRHHPGFKDYIIPAAPKGGYSKAIIETAFEGVLDRTTAMAQTADENERPQITLMPIAVDIVAREVVKDATATIVAPMGVRPGILICASMTETKEEVARAHAMHTDYARAMVEDAHKMYASGNHRDISDEHRRCAEYLGIHTAWKVPLERSDVKKCPVCGEEINAVATKCKHCQEDLVAWYEARPYMNAEEDYAVYHALSLKRERTKAPVPPAAMPGKPIQAPTAQK